MMEDRRWISRSKLARAAEREAERMAQRKVEPMQKKIAAIAGIWAVLLLLAGGAFAQTAAPGKYFDSDGVQIYFTDEGEGEPVLLVHGFALNGTMQWSKTKKALRDNYRVITIDNRGHGRSDKPHDPAQYGIKMVEDQVRLLDHLGIAKAHVVGYSMGGSITLQLAARHPERVHTAAITGSGWRILEDDSTIRREDLAKALENNEGFALLFEGLASTDATDEQRGNTSGMSRMFEVINDQPALAAVMRGGRGGDLTEAEVKAIDLPMIAVIGDLDPILPAAEALKAARPATELAVIEGGTHSNTFGHKHYLDAVAGFVKAHPMPQHE